MKEIATSMHPKQLTPKEKTFIKDIGMLVSETGLSRSTGLVLGLLLVCEPEQLSAAAVQKILKLSSGGVSSALTLLIRLRFVERLTFTGDRRFYYRLHPDCWQRILQDRIFQAQRGLKLVEEGLTYHEGNERLRGMHDLYAKSIKAMKEIHF